MVPTPLQVVAAVAAMLVPVVEVLLLAASDDKRSVRQWPIPPRRAWLRLYRSSRRLTRSVDGLVGVDLRGWDERINAISGVPAGRDPAGVRPVDHHLAAAFINPAADPRRALARLRRTAEGQFLAQVWVPAMFLYGSPPPLLLRRARLGDDTALHALVRLDKSVLLDPGIQQRWHEMARKGEAEQLRLTFAAVAGRPHQRFSAKSIRVTLATGLVRVFERAGHRLTSTQARRLFATETDTGRLSEVDMPAGEALSKALQREKEAQTRRPTKSRKPDKTT